MSRSNLANKCIRKLVVFLASMACIFSSCRISTWLMYSMMSRENVINSLSVTEMLETITTTWVTLLISRKNAMVMRPTSTLNPMLTKWTLFPQDKPTRTTCHLEDKTTRILGSEDEVLVEDQDQINQIKAQNTAFTSTCLPSMIPT